MFCLRCGKELPDGSAFCSKCGTKILDNEKVYNNDKQTKESYNTQGINNNTPIKKNPFLIIYSIIGIILFVLFEFAVNNSGYQLMGEYLYIKYIILNIILFICVLPFFIIAVTKIKKDKSYKFGYIVPIVMIFVMGNVFVKDTEKPSIVLNSETTNVALISNNKLTIAVGEIVNVSGAVRINTTIKNNSSESIMISPFSFTLSITNGDTYNASLGDSTVDTVTLQPGQQASGYLTFIENSTADVSGTQTLNFNGDSATTQQVTVEIPAIQ